MESTASTDKILFTIVFPVYNAAKYLQKSFDSLKKFYDLNISFEIIYVNDGSTDNSLEIVNKLKSENRNIKVITQENQGSSITRNNGLEIAEGRFVQFIDSDDYIDCDVIIEALNYSNQHDLDANSVQLKFVNQNNIKISDAKKHNLVYNKILTGREALFGFMPSSICVFIFKRYFLMENNLRIYPNIVNMDVEFSIRMLVLANKVHFSEKVGYRYVQTENSLKRNNSIAKIKKDYRDQLLVAKLIIENELVDGVDNRLKLRLRELSNNVVWNALYGVIVTDKRVDLNFVNECIEFSTENRLYPIKNPLSTNFQKITSLFLNNRTFIKLFSKLK